MADALYTAAENITTNAPTAAASLATISAGSDVLVSNFAGLQTVLNNLNDLAAALKSGYYAPVGMVSPFAGASAPTGWLLCNGDVVTNGSGTVQGVTANFAELFGVLAGGYGGAGKLPDLRGRAVFGVGTHSDVSGVGLSDAAAVADRSPKHKHSIASLGVSSSVGTLTAQSGGVDHTHGYYQQPGYTAASSAGSGIPRAADNNAASGGYPTNTGGASAYLHTHNVTGTINTSLSGTVGVGSGTSDTVPFVVTNYIIKF